MKNKFVQLFLINFGLILLYTVQKRVAWHLTNFLEDVVYKSVDNEFRDRRPYPKPRRKRLYYKPFSNEREKYED